MSIASLINDFLANKRLIIAGASRDPKSYSRVLMREFIQRGYETIPVNPNASEIEGLACFAKVREVKPSPEAALILTNSAETMNVLEDCREAGISLIWIPPFSARGALRGKALDFCHTNKIKAVAGFCPFMFFPNADSIHGIHRFFLKLFGRFPQTG